MIHKHRDRILFEGVVVSDVDYDKYGTGKVKVRVDGIDDNITDIADIPEAVPLNFFFSSTPKKDEKVYVIVANLLDGDIQSNQGLRFYFGPLIAHPFDAEFTDYNSASALEPTGQFKTKRPPLATLPKYQGAAPRPDYITIKGRYNTDIQQKVDEILLRAGITKKGKQAEFNNIDQPFLQLKYDNDYITSVVEEIEEEYEVDVVPEYLIRVNIDNPATSTFFVNIFVYDLRDKTKPAKVVYTNEKNKEPYTFQDRSEALTKAFTEIQKLKDAYPRWAYNSSTPEISHFIIGEKTTEKETKTRIKRIVKKTVIETDGTGSVANMSATKINLITSKAGRDLGLFKDLDNYIDKDTQIKINTEAQQLPKGRLLVDILKLIIQVILNHRHAYAGLPCTEHIVEQSILDLQKKLAEFDLATILHEDIRIL